MLSKRIGKSLVFFYGRVFFYGFREGRFYSKVELGLIRGYRFSFIGREFLRIGAEKERLFVVVVMDYSG